jgi:hypothetical protein
MAQPRPLPKRLHLAAMPQDHLARCTMNSISSIVIGMVAIGSGTEQSLRNQVSNIWVVLRIGPGRSHVMQGIEGI